MSPLPAILLSSLTASLSLPSLRKGTTATAMETPGCLTCQRSVSTSTARRPLSRTRPIRTSSPLTSRLPTSPSPTRSPATPTPTSATLSTLTLYTSRRRRTSSSRGPADRARTGSAHMEGAAWRLRSSAWKEARPGWGGKGSAGRSCCPHMRTAWSSRLLVIAWGCTTWGTDWRMFKWVHLTEIYVWKLTFVDTCVMCACSTYRYRLPNTVGQYIFGYLTSLAGNKAKVNSFGFSLFYIKEANERKCSLVEYLDRNPTCHGFNIGSIFKRCIWWLIPASVLFYQHVDDHSIIMADQTVIKKGECLLHVCD